MEEGVKIVIEYIKTNAAEYERTYFSLLTQNGRRGKIHFVLKKNIWVWRSLVACLNGVQEAGGSNPLTQTSERADGRNPSALSFFLPRPINARELVSAT